MVEMRFRGLSGSHAEVSLHFTRIQIIFDSIFNVNGQFYASQKQNGFHFGFLKQNCNFISFVWILFSALSSVRLWVLSLKPRLLEDAEWEQSSLIRCDGKWKHLYLIFVYYFGTGTGVFVWSECLRNKSFFFNSKTSNLPHFFFLQNFNDLFVVWNKKKIDAWNLCAIKERNELSASKLCLYKWESRMKTIWSMTTSEENWTCVSTLRLSMREMLIHCGFLK